MEAVNVLVAVHDKDTGRFVTNLSPQHFIVKEDGRRQRITNFAAQTNLPLTIAICVDASASVRLKLGFEKEVATDFLFDVMRPTDKALLLEFDTGVTLLHDFTSNPNALLAEIDNLRAGGGTSLYDAIYLVSEQKMLQEYGRKTILVLSDGSDLTSVHTFDETLRMAFLAESTIYAISTTRFGAGEDAKGDDALEKIDGEHRRHRLLSPFQQQPGGRFPDHRYRAAEPVQHHLRPPPTGRRTAPSGRSRWR